MLPYLVMLVPVCKANLTLPHLANSNDNFNVDHYHGQQHNNEVSNKNCSIRRYEVVKVNEVTLTSL